ncbi:glycoside hydrolase family 113 [Lactiplantibacillus carotarum]|uniref:glycoside hydrolase family 113 n=1 Tax=Lactiplantibacillus carotarum TaxID=2993456 RepID=UPI00298F2352|nr:BppU family phage baseplate upper protein [Lactiplantibacillus carotarum]
MAVTKEGFVQLVIGPHQQAVQDTGATFFHLDSQSAILKYQMITPQLVSIPISVNTWQASIYMLFSDGSKAIHPIEDLTVINATNGEFSYQLTDEELAHTGNVTVQVLLNVPGLGNQVGSWFSSFKIAANLIEDVTAVTKFEYVGDLANWSKLLQMATQEAKDNFDGVKSQYADAASSASSQVGSTAISVMKTLSSAASSTATAVSQYSKEAATVASQIKEGGVLTQAEAATFFKTNLDDSGIATKVEDLKRSTATGLETFSLSMTYSPSDPDRFDNTLVMYKNMVQTITLVNMCDLNGSTGSVLTPVANDVLTQKILDAKTAGYQIAMLKPHIGPGYSDGFVKYEFMPDSVNSFFTNYKNVLLNQAKVAADNGIPALCLSTELNQLVGENYLSYWTDIIDSIRKEYPNLKLTIAAASPFTTDSQTLFNQLDYIGINWYPAYAYKLINQTSDIPDESELQQALLTFHSNAPMDMSATPDIAKFLGVSQKYGKPIWFTETGIEPKPDGLAHLVSSSTADDNYSITAAVLNAFVHSVGQMGPVVGINWWHAQAPFNLGPEGNSAVLTAATSAWQNLQKEVLVND